MSNKTVAWVLDPVQLPVRALGIALVIVIIVITIVAMYRAKKRYQEYLSGYWILYPFNEDGNQESSDLKSSGNKFSDFQLFIAPVEAKSRKGYIIAADLDDVPVINQAISLKEKAGRCRHGDFQGKLLIEPGEQDADNMNKSIPPELDMKLSMQKGTLTLYANGEVYARLVKDFATSEEALKVYKQN